MKTKRIAIATSLFLSLSTTVAQAQQPHDFGDYLSWCYMVQDGEVIDLSPMCDRKPIQKPQPVTNNSGRARVTTEEYNFMGQVAIAEADAACKYGASVTLSKALEMAKADVRETIAPSRLYLVDSPDLRRSIDWARNAEMMMKCPLVTGFSLQGGINAE